MTAVSLTQQQYQQFIDSISGLAARAATLQTHAEAQQEQIRVAEMLIQQLWTAGAKPPHPEPYLLSETSDCEWCHQGVDKVHWETTPSATTGLSARDESLQERTRDLLNCCSGFRDRMMKST